MKTLRLPIYSLFWLYRHHIYYLVHIQYVDKWVIERELGWEKQVRREYDESSGKSIRHFHFIFYHFQPVVLFMDRPTDPNRPTGGF